ncbi:MAG: M23 family metallopeptidase [Bacteroidales bacterium]|nr:M23 family metallopeptidase [Bacteroidales bacterium]MBR4227976.1 M23 family metallopeptidase [Bacteroidales bacterium]
MSGQNKEPKVRNFRLSLVDDMTHRKLWVLHFTKPGFLVTVISAVVVLFAIVYALLAYTPLRTSIPGYPDAHTRRAAIQNAIRMDSLENVISRWEYYSENMLRVIEGEAPLPVDSVIRLADAAVASGRDAAFLAQRDSALRDLVNAEEQFGVTDRQERALPIEGMHFFTPLKGVVSQGFDGVLHPYVEISAPANSVVMAVLDGTVIFDGWDDGSGYTVAIQHEGGIISIYKHNAKLLHKTGDHVSSGTSIALAGDHLRFELWYRGAAVDPAKYIVF